MKEIDAPEVQVPPRPVNEEFWRRLTGTLKSGRAIEITSPEEAGFSSVQSLRVVARKRAQALGAKLHVVKTEAGYAVWYTR